MNINLEYYKVFYYVGKYKKITLAAEALSLSQPAVSQAVQQLEKALGTPLFFRTSKGVEFTSAGQLLYTFAARGYENIKTGENKVLQTLGLEKGEIRIGASDMTLEFYLLPYLEEFHEKYPGIKVIVTNGPTPETIRFLHEGKIDFGVVSTPVSKKPDLHLRKVKEIQDIFVVGHKYKELKDRILDYQELASLPLICLEKNTSTRRYIDEYLAQKQVLLEPEFELATSNIIVQFALRNLGAACVMEAFAKTHLDNQELYQLTFKEKIPKREFCLVTDHKNPLSSAAEQLIQMMVKEK